LAAHVRVEDRRKKPLDEAQLADLAHSPVAIIRRLVAELLGARKALSELPCYYAHRSGGHKETCRYARRPFRCPACDARALLGAE